MSALPRQEEEEDCSASAQNDMEKGHNEPVAEFVPRKKARRVQRQKLVRAIRHFWMVSWFINVVIIDELEEVYYTPGCPTGFQLFVQLLLDKAKQKMSELAEYFGSIGGNVENAHKDEDSLQEMCKQSALNWRREWNLWRESEEKKDWLASQDGAFLWRRFTLTDPLWEAKRDKLAEELDTWFNVVRGSTCKVFIEKDKCFMIDEPITEPSLTCVSIHDICSSWDDEFRIRQDFQADYHLVRFNRKNFIKFYGASIMYVAKRFKHVYGEPQINAQQRLYKEIQISGVRMCGLVNPIAMINDEDCPTLIFPYWNGGTLEDMFLRMKIHQDQAQSEKFDVPDQRLRLFMENRLEIALALLETLRCLHGHGWIHNNLHARNILLHYPTWQWAKDGEPKFSGSTDLVFVGISNFGNACKAAQADSPWAPKFSEWDWKTKPHGPGHHIAPELCRGSDTNKSHMDGMRFYTEMTDIYALGTSIKTLCTGFFAGWDKTKYRVWHDRLNHDAQFIERGGVEYRLVHLLHRLSHLESDVRRTAKFNTRQWREDLGVGSRRVFRPLYGWSV